MCGLAVLLSWTPVLRRTGADGVHDPRVVPLLLALVAVGTLVLAPAGNLVSRRIEARADVHSLDLTRDPQVFADSQRRLALSNLSDLEPHPLAYALFATHPTTTERLAMVREWERLRARHGKQDGTRAMVAVLLLGREFGEAPLRAAIASAVSLGASDVAAVRYLLGEAGLHKVRPEPIDVGALARYDRPMPGVADYDALLVSIPCAGTA